MRFVIIVTTYVSPRTVPYLPTLPWFTLFYNLSVRSTSLVTHVSLSSYCVQTSWCPPEQFDVPPTPPLLIGSCRRFLRLTTVDTCTTYG